MMREIKSHPFPSMLGLKGAPSFLSSETTAATGTTTTTTTTSTTTLHIASLP